MRSLVVAAMATAVSLFSGSAAHAMSLVSATSVNLSVSSPFNIGLDSSNSPTATLVVDDPASTATLFLNGNDGPILVAEDFKIRVTSSSILFEGNNGLSDGDPGETLTVSGLQFVGGDVLSDVVITDTGTSPLGPTLPTLVAGSVSEGGFTLDLDPMVSGLFRQQFEITFITTTGTPVPEPNPALLIAAGLVVAGCAARRKYQRA